MCDQAVVGVAPVIPASALPSDVKVLSRDGVLVHFCFEGAGAGGRDLYDQAVLDMFNRVTVIYWHAGRRECVTVGVVQF